MKKQKSLLICFSVMLLSVLLFQGCLLDVTSVVVPSSTSVGKVITLTVKATATSDGTAHQGGLILQIPNGTSVLRVSYSGSASGIMNENASIITGYVPESGYHIYGASSSDSHDGDGSVMTFKVWLSVPNGVTPGTYTVKAAVGGITESGVWVPQNPQATGTPVLNFSQISGNYVSNSIAISTGTFDSVAPANVTPTVSGDITGGITIAINTYDESAQGDVAKYRVYLSKALFSTTAGRQLLNIMTVPSVTGTSSNSVSFSADIGNNLSYFEIPPGSEHSLWVSGLSLSSYYFAVTAVDLSGNESNPVVVTLAARGNITGSLTDGSNGITSVQPTVYDSNCNGSTYSTSLDSNGNYTATLPAGNYKVLFDGTSAGYVLEWYNNKYSCAAADTVTVTALYTTNLGVTTLAVTTDNCAATTSGPPGQIQIPFISYNSLSGSGYYSGVLTYQSWMNGIGFALEQFTQVSTPSCTTPATLSNGTLTIPKLTLTTSSGAVVNASVVLTSSDGVYYQVTSIY